MIDDFLDDEEQDNIQRMFGAKRAFVKDEAALLSRIAKRVFFSVKWREYEMVILKNRSRKKTHCFGSEQTPSVVSDFRRCNASNEPETSCTKVSTTSILPKRVSSY